MDRYWSDASSDDDYDWRPRTRRQFLMSMLRWQPPPPITPVEKYGTMRVESVETQPPSLVLLLMAYRGDALNQFLKNMQSVMWVKVGPIASSQASPDLIQYRIVLKTKPMLGFRSQFHLRDLWHNIRSYNYRYFNWKSIEETLPLSQQFIETPIVPN